MIDLNASVTGTLPLVEQAAGLLDGTCPPGCRGHAFHHATAGILRAMAARAVEMLDAQPSTRWGIIEPFLTGNIPGWRQAVHTAAVVMQDGDLTPVQRIGQEIRSDHWSAFNRGLWGVVHDVTDYDGRLCYAVAWPDGGNDLWPVTVPVTVSDPTMTYEFREPTP